jgi:hypothetical protein
MKPRHCTHWEWCALPNQKDSRTGQEPGAHGHITTERRVPVMEFLEEFSMENLTDILPLKV